MTLVRSHQRQEANKCLESRRYKNSLSLSFSGTSAPSRSAVETHHSQAAKARPSVSGERSARSLTECLTSDHQCWPTVVHHSQNGRPASSGWQNTLAHIQDLKVKDCRLAVCARTTDDHVPRPLEAKLPSPSPATASRHCRPCTYKCPVHHIHYSYSSTIRKSGQCTSDSLFWHLLGPSCQHPDPIGVRGAVFEYLSRYSLPDLPLSQANKSDVDHFLPLTTP
jgi:hypothetical protein